MDTKALRQKILDLAIRGKLVPQDPNDEPAEVLLERIREQKQQMLKEGKLKKKDIKNDTIIFKGEDNLHYEKFQDGTVKCIEDEIPFEVPEGWEWCRLPIITTDIFAGGDKPDICEKRATEICNIPIYSNGIENDGLYGYTNKPRVTEPSITISARGTIGFCCARKTPFVPIVRLITITPSKEISLYYLKTVFKALIETGEGSSIPQLTVPGIKLKLIPIPPIMEQDRIQSKQDEILKYISDISFEKDKLRRIVQQAKNKILDLAIHGKLVPQDPNDEPASVLLERIRKEKEELIKQGKIKRDKKESVIFKGDDNSYYQDLPENWIKIRLSSISEIITKGTTPRGGRIAYSQSGIGFLRAENIAGYDKLNLSNLNYIDEESHNNYLKRSILKENDILITIAGTLGRTGIVPQQALPLNTNQAVAIIRLVDKNIINVKYLVYAINSPQIKDDLLDKSVDVAIPNLSLENIADCNIPFPPFAEQKRIVTAIEEAFSKLDKISESLA